jgi:histidinol-phosphate aminotransferase
MIEIPPHIQNLSPYKPGQSAAEIQRLYGLSDVVKLASNENPCGASPLALKALQSTQPLHLSLYPDGGHMLRHALSEAFGIPYDNILCHNGSDALLHLIMRAFVQPGDTVLSSQGTFVGYYVAANVAGAKLINIPMHNGYRFDVQAIANAINPSVKIVYIANANNPTGTYITQAEFEWLMQHIPQNILVIMDEAYSEYSRVLRDDYPNTLNTDYPNLITLRTFSKAYGLAALRIGYASANPQILSPMFRCRLPFEPGTPAQIAAIAALQDTEFVEQTVQLNKRGLELLHTELGRQGWEFPESSANFIMIDCGTAEKAQALYMGLLKKGFITRPLQGFGLPHCLRISTGTDSQNLKLVQDMAVLRADFI